MQIPENTMKHILFFSCVLSLILSMIGAMSAGAQMPEDPSELSLQSAINQALQKNPQLIAAKSRFDASIQRITQARSGMLPQAFFTQSYQQPTHPMWVFGAKLNQ